jgi:hypothetical protein
MFWIWDCLKEEKKILFMSRDMSKSIYSCNCLGIMFRSKENQSFCVSFLVSFLCQKKKRLCDARLLCFPSLL